MHNPNNLPPEPRDMIDALRSFGYSPENSIADLIDNSIFAKAKNVNIKFWEGGSIDKTYVSIMDDGVGLNLDELLSKAMKWGASDQPRNEDDLGRFGFGLKSASLAQCKLLTVISKGSEGKINLRKWDVEYLKEINEWDVTDNETPDLAPHIAELKLQKTGTIILWQKLDKMLESEISDPKFSHRPIIKIREKVKKHLSMIFGNYLDKININMPIGNNINTLKPWDPFIQNHLYTDILPEEIIRFDDSEIKFKAFILPASNDFENDLEYDNAGGETGKWVDRQGIYIYRKNRLIAPGGWHNIVIGNKELLPKEKWNRIRIRLDYDGKNDQLWRLDVKKTRIKIPGQIQQRLIPNIKKLMDQIKSTEFQKINLKTHEGYESPWNMIVNKTKKYLKINRKHKLITQIASKLQNEKDLEKLLKLIEGNVPIIKDEVIKEISSLQISKLNNSFIELCLSSSQEEAKKMLEKKYPELKNEIQKLGNN